MNLIIAITAIPVAWAVIVLGLGRIHLRPRRYKRSVAPPPNRKAPLRREDFDLVA
jgi:hypothetical protein